jgi:anaerobic selenocysteine-containing dehydrogenase
VIRPLPARERKWKTKSGKAEFMVPTSIGEDPDMPEREPDSLRKVIKRSDSQFNTTIYGLDDRFRGIKGSRMVILMNPADMEKRGLAQGDRIGLETIADDGVERRVDGLSVVPFDAVSAMTVVVSRPVDSRTMQVATKKPASLPVPAAQLQLGSA